MLFTIEVFRPSKLSSLYTAQLGSARFTPSADGTIVFEFDQFSEDDIGPEILAIKRALSVRLAGNEYSNYQAPSVDSSDGPHFDATMMLAVKAYQATNRDGIVQILENLERHTNPERAFQDQFGTMSRATLAHLHGWSSETGSYEQDSVLRQSCINIVDQAIAIEEARRTSLPAENSPADPNNLSEVLEGTDSGNQNRSVGADGDLHELIREIETHKPSLTPTPREIIPGKDEIALKSGYTLQNPPPRIETAEQKASFFSSSEYLKMESEALQRTFAFYDKRPTFTMLNDSGGRGPVVSNNDLHIQTRAFPLLMNYDHGVDLRFTVGDPTDPMYLPAVERAANRTSFEDSENLISFHRMETPPANDLEAPYMYVFTINTVKLEAINSPSSQSREFNVLEAYAEAKGAYEDVRDLAGKLGLTGGENFAMAFHKKAQGEVDKYKQKWDNARTEFNRKSTKDQLTTIHGALDKKFGINEAIRRRTLQNRFANERKTWESEKRTGVSLPNTTAVVRYDLSGFKNRCVKVAAKMSEYHTEYVRLTGGGKDIKFDPPVNLQTEGDRLVSLHDSLATYIRRRGYKPDRETLEITFGQTDDQKGVTITKIERITFEPPDTKGVKRVATRAKITDLRDGNSRHSILNKSPYNDRVAVGYLYSLNKIYDELNPSQGFMDAISPDLGEDGGITDIFKKCSEITGLGALSFVAKYRLPRADFVVSPSVRKRPSDPDFDIDTNIPGKLYAADQKVKKFADETAKKIGEGNFFSIRNGKVFRIEDAFPLGERCNLSDLYGELINKFNWQALLCDMYACIPDIRPLPPLDIDFDIPDLPDLSTFDPMKLIRPIIEAALMDLLQQFLCALVNAILGILRDPTCEDLFNLAARGLINLVDLLKGRGAQNLSAKMTIIDTLRNSGVPPELYASEDGLGHTPNTVSSLFNDISQILTASQICSLLQGEPTQDILDLIEITMSEKHPDLVKYFYGTEDIKGMFSQLGALIDPEICKVIIETAERTAAENICSDSITEMLKNELEERGVAKDALLKAIEDVKEDAIRRSEAFRALFSGNPVESLFKNGAFPGSPATEMPPFLKDMINNKVGSIADSLRVSLRIDSKNFIDGLYDQLTIPLDQDSENFNAYVAFKFNRAMALLAKMNEEKLMSVDEVDNDELVFNTAGKLDLVRLWKLREYLYSDDSIFLLANEAESDKDKFLEFPNPPVPGIRTKKYKVGEVDIGEGDKVRAFLIDPDCDISNLNRDTNQAKPGRPFARPIITGIVVGKDGNNKVPHRIEIGKYYTKKQQEGRKPKQRDVMIPGFPFQDSGILEGGGRGSPIGIPFELFVGTLTQEMMNDITPKIAELQTDILNHVNTNMQMNFNNELLPAISSVFSVDEEAQREAIARGSEVPNRFRETVTFTQDSTGAQIVFSLPDVGTGPIDNLVHYKEIPADDAETPDTYRIKLSSENFTGEELIIEGIDCALPLEDLDSERYQPLIGGANKKIQEFANLAKESFQYAINNTVTSQEDKNALQEILNQNVDGKTFHSIIGEKRQTFYEVLFESILALYKQSNIFDNEYVKEMAARLMRNEYVDGTNCIVAPMDVFGVDELGSIIAQRVQEEFKNPDFDPHSYDFSTPGPFEKGVKYGLSEFLIRIYVVEFALRSAITMSSFSNIETIKQDSFIEVLLTYMDANLSKLVGDELKTTVFDILKDMTGKTDPRDALKEVTIRQIRDVTDKINFVFGTDNVDINMQTNFLNTLDSTFAVPPDIASEQLSSKEFKMTIGANKPFFYLEKYFKYAGDGDLVTEFKNLLKARLTAKITDLARDETVSETPDETQVTLEQFRDFGGEEEAERVMKIVMDSDDVKNVLADVRKKIEDAKPEVEYYSPKEIQNYFDNLVVDMEDEAEEIREPLDIDDAATLVELYPIKYIKRRRVHIKLNNFKVSPSLGRSEKYDLRLARTPAERKEILDNWAEFANSEFDRGRQHNVFKDFYEERNPRYYKIQTTLTDIFEQMGIDKFDEFFGNGALRPDPNDPTVYGQFKEEVRKFYKLTNPVRSQGYPKDGESISDRCLVLGDIQYTEYTGPLYSEDGRLIAGRNRGETNFYSLDDLDPETNPTVSIISPEQFSREINAISDAEDSLNLNERVYEIWTEFVFHVDNFPVYDYGEMWDPDEVLPEFTQAQFMEMCGITMGNRMPGRAKIEKFGINTTSTFYNFTDTALTNIKNIQDTFDQKLKDLRALNRRVTEKRAQLERYQGMDDDQVIPEGANSGDIFQTTVGHIREANADEIENMTGDRNWNYGLAAAAATRKFLNDQNEWTRDNGVPHEITMKLLQAYNRNRQTGHTAVPRSLRAFKNEIKFDLKAAGGAKFSNDFLTIMEDDIEYQPSTKGFFNQNKWNPESSLDHTVKVLYPLTRLYQTPATSMARKGQKDYINIPIKVLCRRIDYMKGKYDVTRNGTRAVAAIKDSQIFMSYRLGKVLRPVKTVDGVLSEEDITKKKDLLRKAFRNLAQKFKTDMNEVRRMQAKHSAVYEIDQLFNDYYSGRSNLDSRDVGSSPYDRKHYHPAYFSVTKLYGEAARIENEESWSKFGPTDLPMDVPARVGVFDAMFKFNPPQLIKSPKRSGTGADPVFMPSPNGTGYHDPNITIRETLKFVNPNFTPWIYPDASNANLNINPTNLHFRSTTRAGADKYSRREMNANMFKFVMCYLVEYVDRRTIQGLFGKMSPEYWRLHLLENTMENKTYERQARAGRKIGNDRNSIRIRNRMLENERIRSPKHHLAERYSNISMVYADGNSADGTFGSPHTYFDSSNDSKYRAVITSHRNFGTSEDSRFERFKVKDTAGSEFLEQNRNLLASGNQSTTWANSLTREFRVQQNIVNSIQLRQLFTVRALDNILNPSTIDSSIKNVIRAAFYNVIIEDLMFGVRLVGVLNSGDSDEIYDFFGFNRNFNRDSPKSFENLAKEMKSYFVKYQNILNEEQARIAIPFAFYEEKFGAKCVDSMNMVDSYNESFGYLKQELAKQRDYKRLMSFVFPLERIFEVCMVYAMFVLSTKPEMLNILNTSKSELLSNISMVDKVPSLNYANTEGTVVSDVVKACTPALIEEMERNHGSDGFSLDSLGGMFEKFGQILLRQAKEFLIKVPRTLAQATDPTYREMKRKVDSCQLDGITFSQFQTNTGTRELTRGVMNPERSYAPINVAFPYDFMSSFIPFPPYLINPPQLKRSLIKLSNFVINSGILPPQAQLIRDLGGDCGPLGRSSDAYGAFMLGPALLAMGVNELAGDMGKYKTKCPAPEYTALVGEPVPPTPCDDGLDRDPIDGDGEDEATNPCDRTPSPSERDTANDDNSCDESDSNPPEEGSGLPDGVDIP